MMRKVILQSFQIVAVSEEVPQAAEIYVKQGGTEVDEILQIFIEQLL